MKRSLLSLINVCANFYFKARYTLKLQQFVKGDHLVFIDIDNTIADTWPSLINNTLSARKRHAALPVLFGMKNFVIEKYLAKEKIQVIYLSARHTLLYNTTKNWLKQNQFSSFNTSVILVQHPIHKIYFIEKAVKKGHAITYIDDLSYHHEHGSVAMYDEIIQRVQALPVHYIGFDEIMNINNDFQDN